MSAAVPTAHAVLVADHWLHGTQVFQWPLINGAMLQHLAQQLSLLCNTQLMQ